MKKKIPIILVSIMIVEAAVAAGLGFAINDEKQQREQDNAAFLNVNFNMRTVQLNFNLIENNIGSSYYKDGFAMVIPGPKTGTSIDNLNEYIAENDMDLSAYGLTYPLTLYEIVDNPIAVNDLIRIDIYEIEGAKGKSYYEISTFIDKMFGSEAREN